MSSFKCDLCGATYKSGDPDSYRNEAYERALEPIRRFVIIIQDERTGKTVKPHICRSCYEGFLDKKEFINQYHRSRSLPSSSVLYGGMNPQDVIQRQNDIFSGKVRQC